jgi:hypothetical protein
MTTARELFAAIGTAVTEAADELEARMKAFSDAYDQEAQLARTLRHAHCLGYTAEQSHEFINRLPRLRKRRGAPYEWEAVREAMTDEVRSTDRP